MQILALVTLMLLLLSAPIQAAKVYGGSGIGFSNDDSRWVASIVFEKTDKATVWTKSDTFKGKEIALQTGDILTPTDPVDQWDLATIAVPHTTSAAWCDPSANPGNPANTDFAQCYGQAMDSKWFVIDLNGLQKAGLRTVTVTVTAEKFDDGAASETDAGGNPVPGDDDLVPALTVFRGRQDGGAHGSWYPNRFQTKHYWAWKLAPFAPAGNKNRGYATAYGNGANAAATVTGAFKLKPGNQNYLTVAVGGDSRDSAAKHDVNFKLIVRVYAQDPKTDGIFANTFDLCGCEKGKTWWHLAMDHCMAIAECKKPKWSDGPQGHRCQTPAECQTNGGRWACGQKGVICN